jgi:hypothetical protein
VPALGNAVDRNPAGITAATQQNPAVKTLQVAIIHAVLGHLLLPLGLIPALASKGCAPRWAQEPKTNHLQNCAEKIPETLSLTR